MKKNGNSLEELLASWTPRKPSPALRRRIFGAPAEPEPMFSALRLQWLAPVGLSLGIAVMTIGYNPDTLTGISSELRASNALSEPAFSSYMTTHSLHNALALNGEASFPSTTPVSFPSTQPSLSGTNRLKP